MKITCIVGSPRSKGSCAHLINTFLKGVNQENIEICYYSISQMNIHYCLGCKHCYKNGECLQNDDVLKTTLDILDSNYVIIAAPSYWAGVPGQLKTFFDRSTPFGDTNPKRKYITKKSPKGIAIAVRAGMREAENELILDSLEHYYGHLGIETIKRISICHTDSLNDLLENNKNYIEYLYRLGQNLS